MNIRTATLLLFIVCAATTAAAEPRSQYIVVLDPGHGSVSDAAVTQMGGQVDFREANRLVVSVPEGAVADLTRLEGVKYVQR